MNVDDYRKGFMDGVNVNRHEPTQIYIMGYSFDEIIELIQKDREEKFRMTKQRQPIDWSKPLQITTNKGTFKVYNLGHGWKDKRLVQIEECSVRFPSHDGTLPNVFCPDENGYVVQFDRWIENEPMHSDIEIKVIEAVRKSGY